MVKVTDLNSTVQRDLMDVYTSNHRHNQYAAHFHNLRFHHLPLYHLPFSQPAPWTTHLFLSP